MILLKYLHKHLIIKNLPIFKINGIVIKDSFKMMLNMEKEKFILQIINTFKDILIMIWFKVKVHFINKMVKKLQQFGKIINLFNNADNYYFEYDIFFSNYLSF
jgi:hypothetical protein